MDRDRSGCTLKLKYICIQIWRLAWKLLWLHERRKAIFRRGRTAHSGNPRYRLKNRGEKKSTLSKKMTKRKTRTFLAFGHGFKHGSNAWWNAQFFVFPHSIWPDYCSPPKIPTLRSTSLVSLAVFQRMTEESTADTDKRSSPFGCHSTWLTGLWPENKREKLSY